MVNYNAGDAASINEIADLLIELRHLDDQLKCVLLLLEQITEQRRNRNF